MIRRRDMVRGIEIRKFQSGEILENIAIENGASSHTPEPYATTG